MALPGRLQTAFGGLVNGLNRPQRCHDGRVKDTVLKQGGAIQSVADLR